MHRYSTIPWCSSPRAPSVSTTDNGSRSACGTFADAASLRPIVDSLDDAAFPLLVQQRIVGPGVGIFLLLWDGAVRATFAHRRLREKPVSGGVSVYSESVSADPALVERSRQLLEQMQWSGVAMVEYKLETKTGTPYLMEVNGRFWGSLQLAIDAGVDFPALLVAAATGAPLADYRDVSHGRSQPMVVGRCRPAPLTLAQELGRARAAARCSLALALDAGISQRLASARSQRRLPRT